MSRKIEVPQPLNESMSLPDAMRALGWYRSFLSPTENLIRLNLQVFDFLSSLEDLADNELRIKQERIHTLRILRGIIERYLKETESEGPERLAVLAVTVKMEQLRNIIAAYCNGWLNATRSYTAMLNR